MQLFNFIYANPFLFYLMGALQLAFIIHAIVTRRNFYWIFILLFLNALGVILYFFMEVYPNLRRMKIDLEPVKERLQGDETKLKNREAAFAESPTLENRLAIVDLLCDLTRYDEAQDLLNPTLTGPFRDDPRLKYEVAKLAYLKGDTATAKESALAALKDCPFELKPKLNLLLAEIYALLGDDQESDSFYQEAIKLASGEEVKVKYVRYLLNQGRKQEAKEVSERVKRSYKQASNIYQREERPWLQLLAELEKEYAL